MAYTNANSSLATRSSIAGALASFGERSRALVPMLMAESRKPAKQNYDIYSQINLAIAAKTIAPENTNALEPLFNNLKSHDTFVRQQTISALGRLGTNGQQAVPALLNCLFHPDTQTRIDATRALNDIGVTSDEFIVALGENISCTNHFMVQEAESTLGNFAAHSKLAFVTLIKKAVCGPVGRDDRDQAKWTLINISRDDPKFMLECLDDSDAQVRLGALVVFYDLARGVPEAIPKLRQLATNDPDVNVRSRAADVLQLQQQ
jgi:HEAT repeat protein